MRLPYLFSPHWLIWAAGTLSIYIYLIVLYHVNQCRAQLGTNKVVVVELLLLRKHSTLTDITHMDDSLFFYIPANI